MLRGRPALASVFLCLVFLPVVTLQLLTKSKLAPCSRSVVGIVTGLLVKVKDLKWLDCRLYTPTMDDFQSCPSSTLRCFATESYVLIGELKAVTSIPTLRNSSLANSLNSLAKRFNQTTGTDCCQCESHKEKEAEMFLKTLSSVLKSMNSAKLCP